jgi:hypothetical protein
MKNRKKKRRRKKKKKKGKISSPYVEILDPPLHVAVRACVHDCM